MPKGIKDFGISMKEAETRTKELSTAADYSKHEEKAEPQDESEIICHYYSRKNDCDGPMGDERHYVIKNGKMVMAHRRCHKRDQDGEKKTPNMIIR